MVYGWLLVRVYITDLVFAYFSMRLLIVQRLPYIPIGSHSFKLLALSAFQHFQ